MLYSDEITKDSLKSGNPGCSCEGACTDSPTCSCLVRSEGPNYRPDEPLLVRFTSPKHLLGYSVYHKAIFECNSACACRPDKCKNRLVQFRTEDTSALEAYDTQNIGQGVRASRDLRQAEFVCAFNGRYINARYSHEVAATQLKDLGHVYVTIVREFIGENCIFGFDTAIDGADSAIENHTPLPLTCLINHSCDPNMTVIPVRVNSARPILALFALRDIKRGEPLVYDYLEKSGQEFFLLGKKCRCGTPLCHRKFQPSRQ
uniref:Histone-lysine N-methyltransferase SETMAR n=1 Tax=Mesocestoides corti TaxID=53468 RepID=A0A5K3F1A5_MESCO